MAIGSSPIRFQAPSARSYLAACAYRFNRRFNLADLVVKLIVDVVRSPQVTEKKVRRLSMVSNQEPASRFRPFHISVVAGFGSREAHQLLPFLVTIGNGHAPAPVSMSPATSFWKPCAATCQD